MGKPISTMELEAERMREAAEAFKSHVICDRTDMSWLMRPDGKSGYGPLHVAALGRYLVVVGDGPTCAFTGGSYSKPLDMVQWIGGHRDIDYVRGKAEIGMEQGDDFSAYDLNARVAAWDLDRCLETYKSDWKLSRADDDERRQRVAIREAIGAARKMATSGEYGEHHNIRRAIDDLYETGLFEAEDIVGIGRVTSDRVIKAHAIVARLWHLLRTEQVMAEETKKREQAEAQARSDRMNERLDPPRPIPGAAPNWLK